MKGPGPPVSPLAVTGARGLMEVKNADKPSHSLQQSGLTFGRKSKLKSPEVVLDLLQGALLRLGHEHDGEEEAEGGHGGVHPEHAGVAQRGGGGEVRIAPSVRQF